MLVVFGLILSDDVVELFLLSLVVIDVEGGEEGNVAGRSNRFAATRSVLVILIVTGLTALVAQTVLTALLLVLSGPSILYLALDVAVAALLTLWGAVAGGAPA